ncbi:MAG: hypothetical protein ACRDTS_24085, partial [Mycobacterium sp.]
PNPDPFVAVDFEVFLPDADDLAPRAKVAGFTGAQPYRLVLVGEKSSLRLALEPVADRYQADLYLPTGCISNTRVYQLAASANNDGRPLVVLYFSDCDPSGWNMPIEVARKLQAFKISHFPDLEFQCHRAALLPEQVRQYGLPVSPVKETDKRAKAWAAATGLEQTEIDALATLQPRLLRAIAEQAIAPFYDRTLEARVNDARDEWRDQAQSALNEQGGDLEQLRSDVADQLAEKRDEIHELLDAVRVDADSFDLPPLPEIPAAELGPDGSKPKGLCDSRWDFAEQTRRLIASKNYEDCEVSGEPGAGVR